MKKQFGKLFIIFGVILCIFALVGCDLIFVDNPDPEKNPAEESSSEEESGNSEEPLADVFEPDEELILELVEYVRYIGTDFELTNIYLAEQINKIKKGTQPLQVVFDSESEYYFVCAYFNTDHREIGRCCCAEEYIWVGFSNADDIPEYYNGEKYLVAFQIYEASFVSDVVSDERNIPRVWNFEKYGLLFEDGLNINSPSFFEDEFIYLNMSDKDSIYFSTDSHDHYRYRLNYLHLDGKDHIQIHLSFIPPFTEDKLSERLERELGAYYNQLSEIIIIEHESERYYALFELKQFINAVLK